MAALLEKKDQIANGLKGWLGKQPPAVEIAAIGAGGALQGGAIGAMMGSLSKMDPNGGASPFGMPPGGAGNAAQMEMMQGGPVTMARNFAVMTGVNAGATEAIKRSRGGVEDTKGAMGASFLSGACFSLVSGVAKENALGTAASTGVVFALLQGLFYKIGKSFTGGAAADESHFVHTKHLLTSIGMAKYEKNFKRGLLSDECLPLLTESSLADAKIPPGPRLLILSHARAYTGAYPAATSAQQPAALLTPAAQGVAPTK